MADSIRINTDGVLQIAKELENINVKLDEELNSGKADVNSLREIWGGEAADETINNFNSFSDKYFGEYKDLIDSYVRFLRDRVAQGYFDTELNNISIAQSFK